MIPVRVENRGRSLDSGGLFATLRKLAARGSCRIQPAPGPTLRCGRGSWRCDGEEKGYLGYIEARINRSSRWKSGKQAEAIEPARFVYVASFLNQGCVNQEDWKSSQRSPDTGPCFPRFPHACSKPHVDRACSMWNVWARRCRSTGSSGPVLHKIPMLHTFHSRLPQRVKAGSKP